MSADVLETPGPGERHRELREHLLRRGRRHLVGHVDNTTPAMKNLGGNEKWDPLVMGEVRRVEMDRDSGEWKLNWGIKPSDLGLKDYDE